MGSFKYALNLFSSRWCNGIGKKRILSLQKQRFRRLLRHAFKNSPFYRQLYKGIDIDNCRFEDLPTVNKSTLMANFDSVVTDSRFKLNEIQKWLSDRNNRGKLYLGECLPLPSSGTSREYALALYHRDALKG